MISPENKFFNVLSHDVRGSEIPSTSQNGAESNHEQHRLQTLEELGLLDPESVPIFEEATQMAAHFLDAPICILGLISRDRHWFKSAVGLSRIGLMNSLASSRQLPRYESFCNQVVEHQQVLSICDAKNHPDFAETLLVKRYGIRAYLGVPLVASNGSYLGALAIMELAPRTFTTKDIEFLELTARWSMSEYERNQLLKKQWAGHGYDPTDLMPLEPASGLPHHSLASTVKANLIAQMAQELRTPLTSIMGMASVLNREIYGPLTDKQKEYMDIVHTSGQYMLSIVNEILELGALDEHNQELDLTPVDVEMLCQQAISSLAQASKRRDQDIQLSVEPGRRIWLLDKDKVRQMLYHLVFRVIQASSACSVIRIHVSRKQSRLNIAVWISHPWLGDGLPQTELYSSPSSSTALMPGLDPMSDARVTDDSSNGLSQPQPHRPESPSRSDPEESKAEASRYTLGLMLTRQLVEMHGGNLAIQGSLESGFRYVLTLPQLADPSKV